MTPRQPTITGERLAIEMAWAAEETRQRYVVRDEYRARSGEQAWGKLTDFQREQWLLRARSIIESEHTPTPEQAVTPERGPRCLRCGARWVHKDDYAGLGMPHPFEAEAEAAAAPPAESRHQCVEACLHDCPECRHEVDHTGDFHAPSCRHVEAIRASLDARAALAAPAEPLDVRLLVEAINDFITSQTGFDVDDAQAIADLYVIRLARQRGADSPETSEPHAREGTD